MVPVGGKRIGPARFAGNCAWNAQVRISPACLLAVVFANADACSPSASGKKNCAVLHLNRSCCPRANETIRPRSWSPLTCSTAQNEPWEWRARDQGECRNFYVSAGLICNRLELRICPSRIRCVLSALRDPANGRPRLKRVVTSFVGVGVSVRDGGDTDSRIWGSLRCVGADARRGV